MRAPEVTSASKWRVIALCDSRGDCELLDFLYKLEGALVKDGDRVLQLLEHISKQGPPHNTDISHDIDGEIWEFIKGRLSVMWFYDRNRVAVCSHGFVKRSQKTPKAEIHKAQRALKAYKKAVSQGQLEIEEYDDE